MKIQEYVDIKQYSTLKIGGQFRCFAIISSVDDILLACNFAKINKIKIFVLGGGSNIVFSDGVIEMMALKIEIKGFEVVNEKEEYIDIKVGAGEIWDKIVEKTIEMGLSGFEALSIIPGTVGATPVQNVGAYGAEIKDTLLEVEVFDIAENKIKTLLNKECKFGYRDSIFKNEARSKYIITAVIFRLYKSGFKIPNYPGVKRYFIDNNINNPTIKDIREAIVYIRNQKLPDTRINPNVGSFFKNPIVSNDVAEKIQKEYPNTKFFLINDKYTKVPAGWLIENAGLKGKSFGRVSVYDKNALVLVNNGNATKDDLINAKNEIIKTVKQKFGIILEQEPEEV